MEEAIQEAPRRARLHGVSAGIDQGAGGQPFVAVAFCDGQSVFGRYAMSLADARVLRARLDWAIRNAPPPAELLEQT
jgi:hypothetical protein